MRLLLLKMSNRYYRGKDPLWFRIIFPSDFIGPFLFLFLFVVPVVFRVVPSIRHYFHFHSSGTELFLTFVAAYFLRVSYAAVSIGYSYFKKRFIKPKPEEYEKPMPEWIERMFRVIEALGLMVGLFSFTLGIIAAALGLLFYMWEFIQDIFKYLSR